jgi:hypothetical protein
LNALPFSLLLLLLFMTGAPKKNAAPAQRPQK